MADASKIRFTRHTVEKFDVVKHYGFVINRKQVIDTILETEHLDKRGNQFYATKTLDSEHALRVVYENRKGYLIVITFYPVRRERYGV